MLELEFEKAKLAHDAAECKYLRTGADADRAAMIAAGEEVVHLDMEIRAKREKYHATKKTN